MNGIAKIARETFYFMDSVNKYSFFFFNKIPEKCINY